jgi:hypothetical protein
VAQRVFRRIGDDDDRGRPLEQIQASLQLPFSLLTLGQRIQQLWRRRSGSAREPRVCFAVVAEKRVRTSATLLSPAAAAVKVSFFRIVDFAAEASRSLS